MSDALDRSYAGAERVTEIWARSFYFASRFLPREKRRAVFALYDYCRHADNLVDARGDRSAAQARGDLASLAATVRALHRGWVPGSERWLALGDTLQRFAVPLEPLLALLDGVALDLDPVSFENFGELEQYCRLVAGGVGLMLGPVLGATSDEFRERGIGLGVAMQLTNVLRDVGEDLDTGRVYIPVDEMRRFGVDARMLEGRRITPEFVDLMQFQIARARSLFAGAAPVVDLFPRDGSRLTVRLLQATYAGILDGIERLAFDVFRARAYVSRSRKLMILGRALLSEFPIGSGSPKVRSA